MTTLPDTLPATPAVPSAGAQSAVDALSFHLDYLDAKLTAIGEQFADDFTAEHAHELHSAWDEVQQARATLDRLRSRPAAAPPVVDFEEFTTRWDRANEPISALLADRPGYAVAQWAAARARYEVAFVEAVRPIARERAGRIEDLDEAAAQLDRACRELCEQRTPSSVRRPARRRR